MRWHGASFSMTTLMQQLIASRAVRFAGDWGAIGTTPCRMPTTWEVSK